MILLRDIKYIFGARDRIASEQLVAELLTFDDGVWSEYRGRQGTDKYPRRLTQPMLASLLRSFDIRPRTVWPLGQRGPDTRSPSGYYRSQFEQTWRS